MHARRDASGGEPAVGPEIGLEAIEHTISRLLVQVRKARQNEKAQTKRIAQLEHENHALHLALQRTREQRTRDRQVIEMWRTYTSQEAPTTDASTQEGPLNTATMPSSPPIQPQLGVPDLPLSQELSQQQQPNGYGPSQRVLPMSIDVDELYEAQIDRTRDCANGSDDVVVSSSQSEVNAEPSMPLNPVRRMLSQQSEEHATKRLKGSLGDTDSSPTQSHGEDRGLEELLKHTWHPSDFVLNPQPRASSSPSVKHALAEVVRRRHRQCIHGRNCKRCMTFFDLIGSQEVSSRKRSDLPEQETPAGFWRTDFPDSSDAHADQIEAQAQWSAEGQRRLLEAINEGKYLFKDKALREQIHLKLEAGAP